MGPPSDLRTKGPMILRKEDDLTAVPKGQPSPPSIAPPAPPTPAAPITADGGGATPVPGREGLRLPPGVGRDLPRGEDGTKGRPGPLGPSIEGAVRDLERKLAQDRQLGVPTGTGSNLGGLFFDPAGRRLHALDQPTSRTRSTATGSCPSRRSWASGATWTSSSWWSGTGRCPRSGCSARRERPHWTVPRRTHSLGSRLLPLPSDYGPPRVTITVTFYYNEGPAES